MPGQCAAIPAHVPRERVIDVDLYHLPGSENDVHAAWKRVQDAAPASVCWTPRNGGHWIVTRGRDIARIYADHQHFSSGITIVPREWGEQFPLRPTTLDPPEHRFYRRFLNDALSPDTARAAGIHVRTIAAEAASRVRGMGRCDVITGFAAEIPLKLFFALANLSDTEARLLPCYAEDPSETAGIATEAPPVMRRYADYLRRYVVERQRRPGDDLLSRLVTRTVDGRSLSVDEAVDVAVALMTGGIDTVISQLAFMMIWLARHREHRRSLAEDRTRIRGAVVELLRRFPIMTKARVASHDRDIDGVTVKAGDMIVLPPLHGLDEREFDDPMRVDFSRPSLPHSAFGNGVHRCPGASLAQLELEIALDEWLARIPEFELDPQHPPRMRAGILSAVLSAGLQWNPA